MSETPKTLAETTFTAKYAFEYEGYSANPMRYEINAKVLAGLAGGIQDGDAIVELGSGTGNSAIVLAESNPNFEKLIGVEPSRGFVQLAGYKLGISGLYIPPDVDFPLPNHTSEYIGIMRQRALPFRGKIKFVQGRAEALPFSSETADKLYATQVFHWLAFADDDQKGERIEHLDVSLGEITRVLKPGGKFIFDTSGHQFDFRDAKQDGIPLKDMHVLTHPFHRRFIELFNLCLANMGLGESSFVNPNKVSKYNNTLNLEVIEERLAAFGFNLIPSGDDEPYTTTIIPQTKGHVIEFITGGGRMRYFDAPAIKGFSDHEKAALIDRVVDETKAQHEDLLDIPSSEIVVSFAAQKN